MEREYELFVANRVGLVLYPNTLSDIVHVLSPFLRLPEILAPGMQRNHKWYRMFAAQMGDIGMLEWLLSKGVVPFADRATFRAAENGHLRAIQWMVAHGVEKDKYTICAAANNGHLELVKWAISDGFDRKCSARNAAAGGHLETVQFILRPDEDASDALHAAIEFGQFEVCKWLWSNGYRHDVSGSPAVDFAVSYGKLKILEWMMENGAIPTPMATLWAAQNGSLDTLKYAVENGVTLHPDACGHARRDGHQNVVEWIFEYRGVDLITTRMPIL